MARVPVSGSSASQSGIQNASYTYAADAEASDSYAITLSPAVAAYAAGQEFSFKANTANTGAASLNVNSLGAKTLKKNTDQDLATGDIEAGSIVKVVYDGTNFQVVSVDANVTLDEIAAGSTNVHLTTTLKTKLDGIETAADVTDAANVDAAGAVMNSDTSTAGMSFVVDEDNMASDSATKVPTQQSVKAYVDASGGGGIVERQVFTGSGTWTKPGSGTIAVIELWGAGGGGSSNNGGSYRASGGGGGGYNRRTILLSSLGATETVTIGAGGAAVNPSANGNAGGNSTFGSFLTAYGGGGGSSSGTTDQAGAGGGGQFSAGANGNTSATLGGRPTTQSGGSAVAGVGGDGDWGGGGGGGAGAASQSAGGHSIWGGGGGGSTGGSSVNGGAGGAAGSNGTAPGGGGGGSNGTSGAGAAGQCIVTVY